MRSGALWLKGQISPGFVPRLCHSTLSCPPDTPEHPISRMASTTSTYPVPTALPNHYLIYYLIEMQPSQDCRPLFLVETSTHLTADGQRLARANTEGKQRPGSLVGDREVCDRFRGTCR
jgi:hypothetical protein